MTLYNSRNDSKRPNKPKGFTLIELTTVVLVLGIVASVAIPRMLGIGREAKIATLESMGGAMHVAASQVYAHTLMRGVCNGQC